VGAVLAAATLAGCGTSDDRTRVDEVVAGFYRAIAAGDGQAACAMFTSATVQQIERDAGRPCGEAVTELDARGGRIGATEVYITNAKVDLASGESAFLSHEHDGWRISALGCRPDAKPADRPLDCEVES
jgi:hypothetical protein